LGNFSVYFLDAGGRKVALLFFSNLSLRLYKPNCILHLNNVFVLVDIVFLDRCSQMLELHVIFEENCVNHFCPVKHLLRLQGRRLLGQFTIASNHLDPD